jgi:hypothetical protein
VALAARPYRFLPACVIIFFFSFSFLSAGEERGQAEVAGHYFDWAQKAVDEGRLTEALAALERGTDYGDVSSDISYLLALVRLRLNLPRKETLKALETALEAGRWKNYSPGDARLLEAGILITLKRYGDALGILALLPESPQKAALRLKALAFLPNIAEFRSCMEETLDRYPRNTEHAEIFFNFIKKERDAGRFPQENEMALLGLLLKRLPVLLIDKPALAWMAAPFVRDKEEAGRLVAAYRAANTPAAASLPAALNLGIIDEETAIEELFAPQDASPPGLDKALLGEIRDLIRNDTGRALFRRNLYTWSGVITEDSSGDGLAEASALYYKGLLTAYSWDEDQDGLPELSIEAEAGDLRKAEIASPGITVLWEQYPSVMEARLKDERFFPRPRDFHYSPVRFEEIAGSGIVFPKLDPSRAALTRRTLTAWASRVERPSREFPGAVETMRLERSIPIEAWEYLNGRLVSQTDFLRGRPIAQRVDLDLDGRLETFRRFKRLTGPPPGAELQEKETLPDYSREIDYAESDWDGDGIFEIREYNESG